MTKFLKKQQSEIGLSPDELLFRGEQKVDKVTLRMLDFDATHLIEQNIDTLAEILPFKETDSVTWFNVDGLHNTGVMEEIADGFNLDKLVLAEVMNTSARPRIQEYDNCIFISLKMLKINPVSNVIAFENLSIILTKSVLITFQERGGDVFEPVRQRIRKQKKRIRNSRVDYLMYAILDVVIDNYIYNISLLGEKIEGLEDNLLLNPQHEVIEDISAYKGELNYIRKNVKPAKEMILTLSKMESDLINENTEVFFKELQNNINQASEISDSYREILSDQLTIYHTTISSKLNDIMKFLTIFSVIFIPLTFIAGIYGTNFDVVPELHYKYSYFIMLGIMSVVVVGMLIYFKKRKWF